MSAPRHRDAPLTYLENRELSAVTFVRDYIQLHFDGPVLNAYVWPKLNNALGVLEQQTPGYRDALCGQIGRLVIVAVADPTTEISLHFDNNTVIAISLREEDRVGEEAAMFQDRTGKLWNVW
ncbi:hypothetical protein [Reyranella soli]|uniref:Uncharacterized protein n=1 Tax=Reyranella soli TaxID=1230389 RepID=A0A512NRT5_9HYPH|nr:hypothetical protein [Reyranella soli]GEP61666.1 hypothetical protein RSO01_88320 [Reyranella soli]